MLKSTNKIFLIFLVFSFIASKSQNNSNYNDQIKTKKSIISYINIVDEINFSNPDSALKLSTEAYKLSKQIKHDSLIGISILHLGFSYEAKGELDSSLYYYKEYFNLIKKEGDSVLIATAYSNIGSIYYYKSDFNTSLRYYQKALKIYKNRKMVDYIGLMYHNIGMVHHDILDTALAEEYYLKSEKIFIINKDTAQLASCYNSLAALYMTYDYDKSYNYFKKSLNYFAIVNDYIGVCMANSNIGDLKTQIGEIDSAIIYIEKAQKLAHELNDLMMLTSIYTNLASLDLKIANYYMAIIYANKSLKYAKQSSILISQMDAYTMLKTANFEINNYRDALIYSDSAILIKDSIYSLEKTKDIELMEAEFQEKNRLLIIDNLEKEKLISEKELDKKKTQQFFLIIILLGFLTFIFFIIKLLNKRKKLNTDLKISKDDLTEKNEELNQLVEEVTAQKDEINSQKQKIENIYTDLSESINYAQKIQHAIIPKSNVLNNYLANNFVIFKPKDVVSGDFYWFTKINNNLIIALSDCTGHGVPGAFMSMIGVSFLREIVEKEKIQSPDLILLRLREEVINLLNQTEEIGGQKDGMDISIININLDTYEMQYAGANNPIYIVRDKAIKTNDYIQEFNIDDSTNTLYNVKPDKMPIAIFTRMDKFTNKKFQLNKGDLIYMFSDGFADQFGGKKGKKLNYRAFKTLILANSKENLEIQKHNINNSLKLWQGSHSQIDDITLLGIKI